MFVNGNYLNNVEDQDDNTKTTNKQNVKISSTNKNAILQHIQQVIVG